MSAPRYDAVVVGSGPNGLAAAITLAREGLEVLVLEGSRHLGGGVRTAELTLPGFRHDVSSAVYPLALASPFLRALRLEAEGLRWVHPPTPLAHPLDGGRAVTLERSLAATADALGVDGAAYRRLLGPLVDRWQDVVTDVLGPLRWPRTPTVTSAFGIRAPWPAALVARALFRTGEARALWGGLAIHAVQPLERMPTAAFALLVGMLGHAVGWPVPEGGAAALSAALATRLRSLGGRIEMGRPVASLDEVPTARAVLLDVGPRALARLAGDRLPPGYGRALSRYRYGPGVFKLDLALEGPVPWTAEACRRAGTVHVGGSLEDMARAERDAWRGRVPERPLVLVAQPSLFDATRAPRGRHTLWAYCHVPHGFDGDHREAVLAQIERFAPGFRERILALRATSAGALERHNPNNVGGDINGGVQGVWQQFARPVARLEPYVTPLPGVYLCSASTPPGGGVHGMSGYFAACAALRHTFGSSHHSASFHTSGTQPSASRATSA